MINKKNLGTYNPGSNYSTRMAKGLKSHVFQDGGFTKRYDKLSVPLPKGRAPAPNLKQYEFNDDKIRYRVRADNQVVEEDDDNDVIDNFLQKGGGLNPMRASLGGTQSSDWSGVSRDLKHAHTDKWYGYITGQEGYKDLAESIDEFSESPGIRTGLMIGVNALGSLPAVGTAAILGKGAMAAKMAGKALMPVLKNYVPQAVAAVSKDYIVNQGVDAANTVNNAFRKPKLNITADGYPLEQIEVREQRHYGDMHSYAPEYEDGGNMPSGAYSGAYNESVSDSVARTPEDFRNGILVGKTVFPFSEAGPKPMTMKTPMGTVPYPIEYRGYTNNQLTDRGVAYPGEDFVVEGDTVVENKLYDDSYMQPNNSQVKYKYMMQGGKLTKYRIGGSLPQYQSGGGMTANPNAGSIEPPQLPSAKEWDRDMQVGPQPEIDLPPVATPPGAMIDPEVQEMIDMGMTDEEIAEVLALKQDTDYEVTADRLLPGSAPIAGAPAIAPPPGFVPAQNLSYTPPPAVDAANMLQSQYAMTGQGQAITPEEAMNFEATADWNMNVGPNITRAGSEVRSGTGATLAAPAVTTTTTVNQTNELSSLSTTRSGSNMGAAFTSVGLSTPDENSLTDYGSSIYDTMVAPDLPGRLGVPNSGNVFDNTNPAAVSYQRMSSNPKTYTPAFVNDTNRLIAAAQNGAASPADAARRMQALLNTRPNAANGDNSTLAQIVEQSVGVPAADYIASLTDMAARSQADIDDFNASYNNLIDANGVVMRVLDSARQGTERSGQSTGVSDEMKGDFIQLTDRTIKQLDDDAMRSSAALTGTNRQATSARAAKDLIVANSIPQSLGGALPAGTNIGTWINQPSGFDANGNPLPNNGSALKTFYLNSLNQVRDNIRANNATLQTMPAGPQKDALQAATDQLYTQMQTISRTGNYVVDLQRTYDNAYSQAAKDNRSRSKKLGNATSIAGSNTGTGGDALKLRLEQAADRYSDNPFLMPLINSGERQRGAAQDNLTVSNVGNVASGSFLPANAIDGAVNTFNNAARTTSRERGTQSPGDQVPVRPSGRPITSITASPGNYKPQPKNPTYIPPRTTLPTAGRATGNLNETIRSRPAGGQNVGTSNNVTQSKANSAAGTRNQSTVRPKAIAPTPQPAPIQRRDGGSVKPQYMRGQTIKYQEGGSLRTGVVKQYDPFTGNITLY